MRRSPAQEETILEHHEQVRRCIANSAPTTEADFALHVAIAAATNNPRFVEFMQLMGPKAIPRANLPQAAAPDYLQQIHAEHERIVVAISGRDSEAARVAMQEHLVGSERRYRALLRQT